MFAECVYTVREVAALLKISSKTAYRLIRSGEIHAIQVRGQFRITSLALDEYMKGDRNGEERD